MRKSKATAALLALIGGVIGMHKFYLNDPGSGIFYTILSIVTSNIFFMPVGALLGVLDAIRLFSMSTAQFDAKYNKGQASRSRSNQRRSRSNRGRADRRENRGQASREVKAQRARYQNEKTTKSRRANPFRKSADQKFKEYDLEGALEDYDKAADISTPDKTVYFNKACIYSLLEKPNKSLENLEMAMDMGYKDVDKIKTIDELAYLRIQPEYEAFIQNGYKRAEVIKAVKPPKDDLLQDDVLLSQLNKLKELRSRGL